MKEYLAYRIINNSNIYKKKINPNIEKKLDGLFKKFKKLKAPLISDFKIFVVLNLKWEFDYINRHLLDPNLLINSIDYYERILDIYHDLSKDNWIYNIKKKTNKKDIWFNTRKIFNFIWPRTTKLKYFKLSSKMIKPRVEQIVENLPKKFLSNAKILDSGCGPGRYMDQFAKYKPNEIIGIDIGKDIIKTNKLRFKNKKNIKFFKGKFEKLNFNNETFDFVNSAGVIHHSKADIANTIKEHARVLKKNGYFFVFIVGKGGTQLKIWEFVRRLLNDEDIKKIYNSLDNKISPLRLQGILDHSFGEYQQTDRKIFEKILKKNFKKIKRIRGIEGADCTPELYKKDKFFKKRFGTGDLRYLCKK